MAKNLKPWTPLGTAVVLANAQSLTALFPDFANQNNNVFALCIQEHEDNAAGCLIYLGDGSLVSGEVNAGFVLKGPLDFNKFENQGAINSLDFDDFFISTNMGGSKIRAYALLA